MNKKYTLPQTEPQNVAEQTPDYAGTSATAMPVQITVNIEDASMLKEIKHAISMIRGVVSIEKSPAMKSYEQALLQTKMERGIQDIREGRGICRKEGESTEEFFERLCTQ